MVLRIRLFLSYLILFNIADSVRLVLDTIIDFGSWFHWLCYNSEYLGAGGADFLKLPQLSRSKVSLWRQAAYKLRFYGLRVAAKMN